MKSSRKLAGELPVSVKRETLGEVAAEVFKRLTRIGVFAVIIAAIPIALLAIQNKKIQDQNYLIEAQRRSSLVLLMSNVLTDLSREMERQTDGIGKDSLAALDTIGYRLTDPLIGRIASLSQGLLPYRFMVDGKLTEKEYSVERGQLLLAIVNSNLDGQTYRRIFGTSTFEGAYLVGARLNGADLNGADLSKADLFGADLSRADLFGADLSRAHLNGADLSGADLSRANLTETDLRESYLSRVGLSEVYLSRVDLSGVRCLFECKGLDPIWQKELEKEKPCLFEFSGCPE